jgi:hypothetical protein
MLDDFHEAQYGEGRTEEEMEASAKAFYDMLSSAQKPLHDRTTLSQLDAIGHVMGFKSQFNLTREGFDALLALLAACFRRATFFPRA